MKCKNPLSPSTLTLIIIAAWSCATASAQTTTAAPAAPTAPPKAVPGAASPSLDALAWLRGCWKGSAARREFREQWMPAQGGMMVGISHTVVAPKLQGPMQHRLDTAGKEQDPAAEKTQDFEYLRLETRPDGVYYVDIPSGKTERAFKFTAISEDNGAKLYTFANPVDEFPQRLVYRHGKEGWLYAQVMGKPGAETKDVVYPMRHVDCLTDALLED
jgi:uncharacterized protein DUF6265